MGGTSYTRGLGYLMDVVFRTRTVGFSECELNIGGGHFTRRSWGFSLFAVRPGTTLAMLHSLASFLWLASALSQGQLGSMVLNSKTYHPPQLTMEYRAIWIPAVNLLIQPVLLDSARCWTTDLSKLALLQMKVCIKFLRASFSQMKVGLTISNEGVWSH